MTGRHIQGNALPSSPRCALPPRAPTGRPSHARRLPTLVHIHLAMARTAYCQGQALPAQVVLALHALGPRMFLPCQQDVRMRVTDRRRLAVASALGSTRAEGLTVGAATVCDLADYAEGKLTAVQLRALVLARHRKET